MTLFPNKINKLQFVTDKLSSHAKNPKFIILPVPYERTTSYGKGTRKGPKAILDASLQLELLDEETQKETWKRGILTLKPFKSSKSEKLFFKNLENETSRIIKSTKAVPFFLGGEHSITQALIPPFIKKHKNLSVLHFDAHADLRSEYEKSSRNHACAMHPISKLCKIVQVGIRNIAPEEKKYVNSENVRTYLMHDNLNIDKLSSKVISSLTSKVYISIDADGFDPSVMPGTGTPQPGGFTWYDALCLFRKICEHKEVVGMDMVEVSPQKNSPITEFAAAKLIYKIMGYLSA